MKKGIGHQGFTLIELLTVVFILCILIGLLAGVLQQAKTRARKYKCAAEVRELARAWESYYATYGSLPAVSVMNGAAVGILRGNNSQNIKFMDFPISAGTTGFTDPWGGLYHVELAELPTGTTNRFVTRVYLQNREAWKYE